MSAALGDERITSRGAEPCRCIRTTRDAVGSSAEGNSNIFALNRQGLATAVTGDFHDQCKIRSPVALLVVA